MIKNEESKEKWNALNLLNKYFPQAESYIEIDSLVLFDCSIFKFKTI